MPAKKERKPSISEKEQFWVLPLPKWDRSEKDLSIRQLASKQSIEEVEFKGKRVLVRVDYNVPIKEGKVTDPTRILASLDSIKYMLSNKQRLPKCIVLICHLGRPGGRFKKEDFSLRPVANLLREYLQDYAPVKFLEQCVGPDVEEEINATESCTVYLLENLRFHIEECGKSVSAKGEKRKAVPEAVTRFRKALSRLGDVFVFEAFGAAHRPHSSVVGVDLPQRVAGLLMKKELTYYSKVLGNPERPFLAIIGGSKVTDKIKVIQNMLKIADEVIIGGGMAYTFKKVCDGVEIGSSLYDKDGAMIVGQIMEAAAKKGVKIHLPVDHVIADDFSPDAKSRMVDDNEGIPEGWMALDVGDTSIRQFKAVMGRAKTILWNGPLGVFEFKKFAKGTESCMVEMVKATARDCTTIIGGGDTGAASRVFKVGSKAVAEQISHASTGGGSSLVLMEGKMLPGVAHLSEKTDLPPSHLDYATMWMETKSIKREQQNIKAKLASMEQSIKRALEMAAISKTKKERGSMLWEMLSDHHTEIALVAGALLGAAIAARKR
uniref:Phosphoglycerate kinase n=1 Tax=Lotharella globosa TaxID=91324 RepID=A0A7S3YT37_9EUKA